jgi:magnesium transporter
MLDREHAEDFFLQLNGQDKVELMFGLKPAERKFWMRLLPADAVVDAVEQAPENEREALLALLDDKTRREAKGLMHYDEERNKGAVHQQYARLRPDMSVDEAVSFLRRDARERPQSVYYAYVIDSEERLLGVVFFRDLLMTSGASMIRDIMRTDVVTAKQGLDGEALKSLFDRYNLQMIPVVDAQQRITGVVTRQDTDAGDPQKQSSATTRST